MTVRRPLLLPHLIGGVLAHDRLRTALAVLAIALGVALGYAVQTINASAISELAHGVQVLSGDADLEVRGPRSGFDEGLYPIIARMKDVAVASPVVEIDAALADRDGTLRIVGIDLFRAARIQPGIVPDVRDRLDVLDPDALFLSEVAQAALARDGSPRDTLALRSPSGTLSLRIKGTVPAAARQWLGVMDIAGAQQHFDRAGLLSRIDLRLRPGVDVDAFARTLQSRLPAGLLVSRPDASVAAGASISRAYRVNLEVLALIALFTGALLVFSTHALAVVRRRSELALLRVLGLRRRDLVALLTAEGAVLGLAGGVLGVATGHLLASLALRLFGADLGSGYFRGIASRPDFDAIDAMLFAALGILAAMAGSVVPAIEAARAPPAQALKAGDAQTALRTRVPWPLIAGALGLAAIAPFAPAVGGLPLFGYAGIALLLMGTLMLLPRIAAWAWSIMPRSRHPAMLLAREQLRAAPGQASVSLMSIVASIALVISMGIMVHSFRVSLDHWLDRVLPADLYVRAAGGGDAGVFDGAAQAAIRAVPGARRVDFLREQQILLAPDRPRVVLLARDLGDVHPDQALPMIDLAQLPEGAPRIWVNEAASALYGWRLRDTVEIPLAGRAVPFIVAGIWRDYARQQGAVVMERSRYVAATGDVQASSAAVWVDAGRLAEVRAAIERALPSRELDVTSPQEIRDLSLRAFDRTFAVTYALEAAAVMIGLVGLSSAFGALVLARRREFGMLRHIGMLRRQIAALLAVEGLLVSGAGLLVGAILGFVMSLVLIHVINRQSFHWGMDLHVPWVPIATGIVVVLVSSMLTSVGSGRAAMGGDAVRAVREDW